jgi:magnesium-transporting ATPase (P-type)
VQRLRRYGPNLNALQRLLPPQVSVLRGGSAVRAPVAQLVPGDVILIEQGDVVPADRHLIEAFRCSRPSDVRGPTLAWMTAIK